MSVLGVFDIALTSMFATKKALDTTAHNVSNSSTPGYTRQDVVLESIPTGTITSAGDSGRGVRMSGVKRLYDSFVTLQLNTEKSNFSYWDDYQKGIVKIENIFNDASGNGMSTVFNDFFNAWQDVAQNPEGYAQRTLLVKKADDLSSRLNRAYTTLDTERADIVTGSQSLVNEINTISSKISDLNTKIAGSPGALDLIDQRDGLLQRLNEIVRVTSYENSAGVTSVLIGGTPLVDGGRVFNMSVSTDTANNMHFNVNITNGVGAIIETRDITSIIAGGPATGGELKANLDLRETKLPGFMNKLNYLAVDLADITNYYHKQGYGLDSLPGGNFFKPLTLLAKYTSVGFATDPSTTTFTANGGTLTVKLGDNDTTPATVTIAANSTLNAVASAINAQAGSKVSAAVVDLGTSTAHDYRISIKSNPDGRLGDVRISAATTDALGAGLNLLSTSAVISSMSVTDTTSANPQAQYKVDYNTTGGAGYQQEDTTGRYWRVQKSTDGSTWTTITPNTGYIPSNPSTLNQTQVNLTTDTTGSFWRTLEFEGVKVRIDGNWGTNPNGETFDVQLDPNAAKNIATTFTDPKRIASSIDTFSIDSSNNGIVFNVGGANITTTIPPGSYAPGDLAAALTTALQSASGVSDTYTVAYNPNVKQFKIIKASGANPLNILWTNAGSTGKQVFGFSADANIAAGAGSYAVSDNPASVLSTAIKAIPGDNRNANTIADQANQTVFAGMKPLDFYRGLVSDVGVEALSAKESVKFENTIVEELNKRRDELSGVSLDEEAANLIKYQKSFEAAAKMISMANDLLDTIMKMTGR